jgi:methionyl-tRNA formyltransferase
VFLRIVFMGSPEFALPTLKALTGSFPVVGVVTQPDRPAGRNQRLASPPVKVLAQELGLPVIQPRRLSEEAAMAQLQAWEPDLIVVAAFGQILRAEVLNLPSHGCLNVHASLLPRWRGAAPIQAAILHGDQVTGVTIMKMDAGIDTGPILSQRAVPILPEDTAGTLSLKLADAGAELLLATLPPYLQGTLQPLPQQGEPTFAPVLRKQDGDLDLTRPAEFLARQVRAYNPWPGAFTQWNGQLLKIHRAHAARSENSATLPARPGARTVLADQPAFVTGAGLLVLDEVQPAGKKAMRGSDFLRGARNWYGSNA